MKFQKLFLFIFAASLFASCVKTDNAATAGVAFQLKAVLSPVQGAGIVWTIGTASVSEVKLEARKSGNVQHRRKSNDTFKASLLCAGNWRSR